MADGRSVHRPRREVPRGGRAGVGPPARTARTPQTEARTARALRGSPQRLPRGRRFHRRRMPASRARTARSASPDRGARVSLQQSKLANGLTVVSHAMPEVETVSLGLWVGAGSRSEAPGEHGVAHFLEHMAFKGTARRSAQDIAERSRPWAASSTLQPASTPPPIMRAFCARICRSHSTS